MVSNHTDNVLDIGAVAEKGIDRGGYDQSFNLRELDSLDRILE